MELNDFLMSPIAEVKDLAERAQNIQTLCENGEITVEQAAELAGDLLELKHINQDIVAIEVQRELWQVVKFLQNLKFFASLF